MELGLLKGEQVMGVELIAWDGEKGEGVENQLSKTILSHRKLCPPTPSPLKQGILRGALLTAVNEG
jgi:hypothetical protein